MREECFHGYSTRYTCEDCVVEAKQFGQDYVNIDGRWIITNKKKTLISSGWVSDSGFRFQSAAIVKPTLDSGIYSFTKTDTGKLFFAKQLFSMDEPAILPGLPITYILDQIKLFGEKESEYQKYGLVHKRGVLLYGEPGCGKTCIIKLLSDYIVKTGGIVFSINDFIEASQFVQEFRKIEPTRPILTIQEDIEGLFLGSQGDAQIKAALSFLDGQDQVNNIVHVATTNQPEKIADRFIKRPGRFDLVIGIHAPSEETRRAYFDHIFKGSVQKDKLDELVQKTEGLGLAYLREVASTFLCLNIPLEETLERLKVNSKTKVFSSKNQKSVGFSIGYDGWKSGDKKNDSD